MDKVKTGIIGVGNIGYAHAKSIFTGTAGDLRLAALCDIAPERVERCKAAFPKVPVFSDYRQMLTSAPLDAVIVAVPHRLHCDIALDVLKSGRHVLVEKPIDVTVTKAAELNAFANMRNLVFAIMFNQRTDPLFIRARELVKSGELGQLKRSVWIVTNWYRTQKYYDSADWRATWAGEGGGVLLNQAPHNLDLWQWICGMPQEITAYLDTAKYHNIEVEDDVSLFAKYENGATGTFLTSTGEYPGTNRLEISGTRGKLVLENGTLKSYALAQDEREVCFNSAESSPQIPTAYEEFTPENGGSAHNGILRNFADAILRGAPLIAPGVEGIRELTISNAAYLSAWKGNIPIKLPFDSREFDQMLAERAAKSKAKPAESRTSQSDGNYTARWKVNW